MQTHYSEIPSFLMDQTNKNPAMMNSTNVSTPYSPYHYVNSAPVGGSATTTATNNNVSINMINSKKLDPWTLYELAKETQKIKMDRQQQQKDTFVQHDKDKPKLQENSQLEVSATCSGKQTTAAGLRSNNKSILLLENQLSNNYFGNKNTFLMNASNCNGKLRSKSLLQLPIMTTATNASDESRQEVQKRIELAKSKRKSLLCEVMQQQQLQAAASAASTAKNVVPPKKSSKKSKKPSSSSSKTSSKTAKSKKRSSSKKLGDSISSLPALLLGDDDEEDVFRFLEDEEDAEYHHSCNF